MPIELAEVDIAQNVHIMNKDRVVRVEERGSVAYAATGVKELLALIADADVESKVVVGIEIVNDLSGKMVDVDHKARDTGIAQFEDYALEQGLTANLHHSFWHVVGEGLEACAQACCENHCLHHLLKSSSLCWCKDTNNLCF